MYNYLKSDSTPITLTLESDDVEYLLSYLDEDAQDSQPNSIR